MSFPCGSGALNHAFAGCVGREPILGSSDSSTDALISEAMAITIRTAVVHELQPLVISICETIQDLIDALHASILS